MKKFFAILIMILLSSFLMPLSASASTISFEIGTVNAQQGAVNVIVPITVKGTNPGFAAVALEVKYNPAHLILTNITSAVPNHLPVSTWEKSDVPGVQWVLFIRPIPIEWTGTDAVFANLHFDVRTDFSVGTQAIPSHISASFIEVNTGGRSAVGRPHNINGQPLAGSQPTPGQINISASGGSSVVPPVTTRLLHTDLHGGTGGPNFPSTIPQSPAWVIPTTPRPTRANHEFAGWSLTRGGNVVDRVPAATGATAADPIVLHANWTMNFISVTDITVPATPIRPGDTITLVEQALPRNATNRVIIWDVINPGPTGATINTGNSYSFTAPRAGTATIQATVINGVVVGGVLSNFTQRFDIIVSADGSTGTTPPGTPGGGGTTPPPGTTAPPAGVTRPSGAGNLTVIEHFGTWTGSGTRTARVDADHNTFQRLWFGDNLVSTAHLTIGAGSTTITLGESFIRNLSDGTYSFIAEFSGGHATLNLIVSRAFGNVPQTGVPDITLTTIIMGISLFLTLTVGVLLFFHLRAKRSNRYIGFDSGGVTIEKVRSNE